MADRTRITGAGNESGGSGRKGGARGGAVEPPKGPDGKRASAKRAAPRAKRPELKKDLRDFASGRPEGWSHDDWLSFLESLQNRGHDIKDREAIGLALERERLDIALSAIKGVGPQRRNALIERYGTLWNLRNADPDEIATVGKLSRPLAEQVKREM